MTFDPLRDPGLELKLYVEPCPECAVGKCGNCDGRTLDHATDEIVPCPCRAAGHDVRTA